jgi:hypothetical protein
MTIDDLEFRKIQYSRELAAYTLRQWNLTCESLENPRSFAAASANTAVSQQISRGRSGSRVRNGTGTDTGMRVCLTGL